MQTESFIDPLLIGKDLNLKTARNAFAHLFNTASGDTRFSKSLLLLLRKKGESAGELAGLVSWIRSQEPKRTIKQPFLVDACGTGGDGQKSFNISTVAALVAAGAGASVAKHGNRGISSKVGSADLLESLGIAITAPYAKMKNTLIKTGFGYFHAPQYHPIFKKVQPLRAELGKRKIKTIFNMAGPLLNPVGVQKQAIGVFRKDLAPLMAQSCKYLKHKKAFVFYNLSGLDELGTAKANIYYSLNKGKIKKGLLSAKSYNLRPASASLLRGGNRHQNTTLALNLLSGKDKSPRLDVILLNAGVILWVSEKTKTIEEGILLARKSIAGKRALGIVKKLRK